MSAHPRRFEVMLPADTDKRITVTPGVTVDCDDVSAELAGQRARARPRGTGPTTPRAALVASVKGPAYRCDGESLVVVTDEAFDRLAQLANQLEDIEIEIEKTPLAGVALAARDHDVHAGRGDGRGRMAREPIDDRTADGARFPCRVVFRWRDDLDVCDPLPDDDDDPIPLWRISCTSRFQNGEHDAEVDAGEAVNVRGYDRGSLEAALVWLDGAEHVSWSRPHREVP